LTDGNLKTGLILLRDQRDEANILIRAIAKDLIVSSENEFNAMAIVNSNGPAGSLSNDTNTVPRLNVVVMDYLTSSTAWFLKASNLENLKWMWREKPLFDSQPIPKTVDYFLFGYMRGAAGYTDWRGLVASLGT
jgi:hypothetical protein